MSLKRTSKAETLHELHQSFFVMPTIWDPLSALAAVEAGYAAVATSSAALGQGLAIQASERIPFDTLTAQVARIAAAVPVPMVVDMEDGYPEVAGGVDASIRRLIGAGAVGVNIEDSWHGHARPLASAEDHARRLAQARRAADAELPGFFLNGRTDLFLQNPGVEPHVSLREAIRRAKLYVEAGADGIYVTLRGAAADDVRELVSQIPAPLTLVAGEGQDLGEWRDLGVRRASLGTILIRNSFDALSRQLIAIRDDRRIAPNAPTDIDGAISRNRPAAVA
ncbi:isocitrate lyase/phosphoenolpyruvate mutase family protein [Aureimonas sp. ME7]|uniref:isocitrate lyase/PEP mutase family protein n=1 Tax=Aureimonas sp. ME7 TaxID=2744252 RepID=UPI0015F4C4E3|nr:isocitrate lyase/phosphoenolpyruvate mutase family protein [Aureimonas sp. ME7]